MPALSPSESGELISKLSEHVKIKDEGINKLGKMVLDKTLKGKVSVNNFSQNDIHPKAENSWASDWLFIVDSLNFCFWHMDNDKFGWKVNGKSGYFALCAAINRAMTEKVDILNPSFYANITEEQLSRMLRSDNNVQIPLLKERVKCLQQSGQVLIEKFNGTFKNCIEQANRSAVALVKIITDSFEHFRDESEYKGNKVSFYKRAQILVADVWSCYKGKDLGYFHDIDKLTMFADYRVPQVLVLFGVLEYSSELTEKLDKNEVLDNNSEIVIEIRGCTIHAVELLKTYVNSQLSDEKINSVMIDHFLWDYRRSHSREIYQKGITFHKCYCIYY